MTLWYTCNEWRSDVFVGFMLLHLLKHNEELTAVCMIPPGMWMWLIIPRCWTHPSPYTSICTWPRPLSAHVHALNGVLSERVKPDTTALTPHGSFGRWSWGITCCLSSNSVWQLCEPLVSLLTSSCFPLCWMTFNQTVLPLCLATVTKKKKITGGERTGWILPWVLKISCILAYTHHPSHCLLH